MTFEINHLAIEDGRLDAWREKYGAPARVHGIHCTIVPEDSREFRRWMKMNCPTAKIERSVILYGIGSRRWQNSQYKIVVSDPKEQMIFTLKYL